MSAETEAELLGKLKENLRHAAEHCDVLSHHPLRGFVYDRFRHDLLSIEKICNRMAYYRNGDARWLPIGMMMAEAHRRAGNWLRRSPTEDTRKAVHPMFLKLGENLKALYAQIIALETRKTGRMGPILPVVMPGPHRPKLLVPVHKVAPSLIMAAGTSLH